MGPTGKGIFLTKGVGQASRETHVVRACTARRANRRVQSGASQLDFSARLQSRLDPGRTEDADAGPDRLRGDVRQLHRRTASADGGLGRPRDSGRQGSYGYLSEHKSFGQTDEKAGDYAEDLAATMLATALGVDFDPNVSYDERKDVWKLSDKIVRPATSRSRQSAIATACGRQW